MSIIQVLDDHLTNMIAAGEVVERPGGVIKELVENSLDAHASQIIVSIGDGGRNFIEVKDDGCGMDPSDATKAFQRHATSKIHNENDLWRIQTMGFRGEALPSIASVAKVHLLTCDGETATEVVIEYGQIKSAIPTRGNKGTTIRVEGLFYKTPARLKHLKSGNVEANYILDLIQRFALSHPEVSFEFYSDDRLRMKTNGNGSLQETIMTVYGREVALNSLPVEFSDYDFKVNGVIVLPSVNRATKQYIQLFINGRIVHSLNLQRAIMEAYTGYMMPDRFPIVILNVESDYQLVDVNVHPSKWEIRLSKERQLYDLLYNQIRFFLHEHLQPGQVKIEPKKPEKVEQQPLFRETYTPVVEETDNLIMEQQAEYLKKEEVKPTVMIERFSFLAQYHGDYILAYDNENLYIIDQHAAMERCMYEQIQDQVASSNIIMQDLLIPLIVDVSSTEMNNLEGINEVLSSIGMKAEPFSTNSLLFRSVPVWFEDLDEQHFLRDVIEAIMNDKKMNQLEIRKDRLATLACHSSVKFNHYLNELECRKLLSRLSSCRQPFNCPHGRPTMMAISDSQLIKEFKR